MKRYEVKNVTRRIFEFKAGYNSIAPRLVFLKVVRFAVYYESAYRCGAFLALVRKSQLYK